MSKRDYEPLFKCGYCLDTSWRPFRCDGHTAGARGDRDIHLAMYRCGRPQAHSAHGYVERCQCWSATRPAQPEAA